MKFVDWVQCVKLCLNMLCSEYTLCVKTAHTPLLLGIECTVSKQIGVKLNGLVMQLALNYTPNVVTIATNSSPVYSNSNLSEAVYAQQQLPRIIGKHCCN